MEEDTETEIRDKKTMQDKKRAEFSEKEARAERIQRSLNALGEDDAESDLRQVLLTAADKATVSTSEKKKRADLESKKAFCARERKR